MEIINDKGLLIRTRNPQKITTAIPKSKVVSTKDDVTKVIVHWSLENARKLANMGFYSAPAPILRDYDWPGLYTPFEHQKITASYMVANNRMFCLNEQGLGKTGSVVWAVDYLMNIGDISKVLVVCPLSIMHSAWVDDFFKLAMHRTTVVAHGTRKKRLDMINKNADVTIINYEGIGSVLEALREAKYDLIVADEANYVKNQTTSRWKNLNKLIRPTTKLWFMTGTPAAQSPEDAFGLGKMVVPQRAPKYFNVWRDKVMIKVSPFRWIPKPNAKELVNAMLQPAIRYEKKDCLDLPPVTYQSRDVGMSKQQEKFYGALRKHMIFEAAGEHVTAPNAAANMNKLLQIACGCVYTDDGEVLRFDAPERMTAVLDCVNESSHKVIVFVPFRHAIDMVTEHLRKHKVTAEIIRGDVPATKRQRIFRDFQETDNIKVLVIQPQSASHGVTLTAANTIVWFGPTTSVETWLQANERINRPSQENKMTIIKLFGSDVEKRIYASLEAKESAQKALTDMYNEITMS